MQPGDEADRPGATNGLWRRPPGRGGGSVIVLIALLALLFVSVAGYAYQRIGISRGWFEIIIVGALVGSRVDIPVWRGPAGGRTDTVDLIVFGARYRIPVVRQRARSTLAVNVGGAVIPLVVSVYLLVHDHAWLGGLLVAAPVAIGVRLVARPVAGIGIVIPPLLPPMIAAVAAVAVGGPSSAALAFVGGTIGTLVGGDLANLGRIRKLAAPIASIGGAGTFDGIFLSGVLAVLLATL